MTISLLIQADQCSGNAEIIETMKRLSSGGTQLEKDPNGFLYTLPGILIAVTGYSLTHIIARLLASGNLGDDDPLDNLFIQIFSPGYTPDHGPLYDWILWVLQHWLGTGIHAFLALKYTLLVIMAGYLFLITRRITGSGLWGFLSVESMAIIYQIFWRFHEGFTTRVGCMALAVMTVWAVLKLIDRGLRRDYLFLGVLIGLGLLTEHTYAVLLFALFVAVILQPAMRKRLSARWLISAFVIAGLIVSPYAAWIAADPQRIAIFWADLLPIPQHYTWAGFYHSLGRSLFAPLLVLSPYILFLPILFPGLLREIAFHTPVRLMNRDKPDHLQLLLHALLVELFLLIICDSLLFQRIEYPVHSLLPMMMIAIVWLTAKACKSSPGPRRIRYFIILTFVFAIGAFIGRAANMFLLEPVCSKCRWATPYAELAETLRAAGFDGKGGTVMTRDVRLGGNLRRFFPDSHFVVSDPALESLEKVCRSDEPITIVWEKGEKMKRVLKSLQPYLPENLDTSSFKLPEKVQIPWPHLWKPKGYRYSTWKYFILNENEGQ